ncbi:flagellar filament capping protein FliD [Clostridium isatidis]|uniref:Flagellar hook-associated protein 2 n=1 Tax=Clostridium isatidis TaxID=182773 RepID=A0A343JC63_9CLOT|nr:flagellar filament capping protein FliD [Clostridium isatidis]ASW43121.1 flagellar cap protein FliD [Clostridium isatidis]
MRITGLATGLDIDEVIKASMKPYRVKIDQKGQQKEILEIKQKLYRDVIKETRELYNKYFDILNADSLLLNKNWATTKFTSSSNSVIITASGEAKPENYTITGHIAKASKISVPSSQIIDNKITINGIEFELSGGTEKEKAANLTNQLKKAGINVKATYTNFAGDKDSNASGYILESTILGKDSIFTVGGTANTSALEVINPKKYADPTAAKITGFKVSDFEDDVITIVINGDEDKKITLNSSDFKNEEGKIDEGKLEKVLNEKLKGYNLKVSIEENEEDNEEGNKIIFESTTLGNIDEISISVNNKINEDFIPGLDKVKAEKTFNLSEIENKKITINGVLIDLSLKGEMTTVDYLNKVSKDQNLNIVVEDNGTQLRFISNNTGEKAQIDIQLLEGTYKISEGGQDAEIVFTNGKGGIYTHKGISNNVTLDGVTFKFTEEIPENEDIKITGKTDVTEIKDKIVKFINDYNTLIEKLNKLTTEKRDRSFMPLTSDQKKEMSENEIKLWNERVERGQLSRDSDLTRIVNSLKNSMRTIVDGSNINLEKIGIVSVKDYQGTKNGTFTIDENTLIKALEENSEEVMNLFVKSSPKDESMSPSDKYNKTGILNRIKDVLYNETISSNSNFLKKVGYEGTVTAYNNTLTKSIEEYERKMKDMEINFAKREQALYSKYATLETMMNKLNSQQSYLLQQLGMV